MIWQAFAECDCIEEETRDVPIYLTPDVAFRSRIDRKYDGGGYVDRLCALRRISWTLEGNLLLDVSLSRLCVETTHRVRAAGEVGAVSWPEPLFPLFGKRAEVSGSRVWGLSQESIYSIPVFRAGERLTWTVLTLAGRGVACFTLDFERVS